MQDLATTVKPWRGVLRSLPLALLVAGNLVPIVGVLLWDWDVRAILILYWSENLILGGLTILKMLLRSPILGIFSSAFFLIHYGGFCGVHGFFILALTQANVGDPVGSNPWPLWLVFVQILFNTIVQVLIIAPPEWLYAFLGLVISHGASFTANYLMRGEYKNAEIGKLMQAPYKRVIVLHLAIIFGGWGVMALGSPAALLIVLILLKITFDVHAHRKEHREKLETVSSPS